MTPWRIFVADDEAPARRKLIRMLEAEGGIEVVGQAAAGGPALEEIRRLRPALVFLDVQMPGMSGLEVAEQLVDEDSPPQIVFVTAHDEYAVRAFELHACGYLLKPYDRARFAAAYAHARSQLGTRHELDTQLRAALAALRLRSPWPARLPVPSGERMEFVEVARLERVEACRNYVQLHADGRCWTMRTTLEAIAEQLNPEEFLRLNRSQIVRASEIQELRNWSHGEFKVRLRDGAELTWTRRYVRQSRPYLKPLSGRSG